METVLVDVGSDFINSSSVLEGVGDEVLLGFLFLLLFLVVFFSPLLLTLLRPSPLPPPEGEGLTPDEIRDQFLAERRRTMVRHYQDRQCPICLGDARLAIETNCGHLFCGPCITSYWTTQHPSQLQPVQCPCCRQTVSVVFPSFTPAETSDAVPNENGDASQEEAAEARRGTEHAINDYNRRFSGQPRPWMDYVYDLPVILRHLLGELFSVSGLAILFRLRVAFFLLGAILYVVSPLDIIPEAMFGIFGLADDVFMVLILGIYLSVQYRRVLANRGGQHED